MGTYWKEVNYVKIPLFKFWSRGKVNKIPQFNPNFPPILINNNVYKQ